MRSALVPSLAAVLMILGARHVSAAPQAAPKAADAPRVTVSGCLSGGPGKFVLTNVVAAGAGKEETGRGGPPPALARSYALVPRDGLSLTPYAGHRVEVTGTVTELEPGAADDAARGKGSREPTASLAVASVKSISPICLQ
jgi:hypothetical protein